MAAYRTIRSVIGHLKQDRILAADIAAMRGLIRSNRILDAVEAAVGRLN